MKRVATLIAALSVAAVAQAVPPPGPAPAFDVPDATGKRVRLDDLRGRYVVLEWTNPECPFVRKHYDSRNMQALQRAYGDKDVVWLSINSTRQGHDEFKTGAQMIAWMGERGAAQQAILIDGSSAAGRAYGAKTTPEMVVIDPKGNVIYAGAIDDKRSTNPADVKTARNHVRAALDEALAGKAVSVASTAPYGCSVKY